MKRNEATRSALVVLLAAGCAGPSVELGLVATPGSPVTAEVSAGPHGTLHVDTLYLIGGTAAASSDDDDVECEDGLTP
ncbi:MAG: hypothetical protein H6733_00075, partial [Alphaproteobacteria bacterium]|nr:hypothetical protein [Alphaproteobacteria bacterium]